MPCSASHRAAGEVKANHRKYLRGWWPPLAQCLLTSTDPTKADAPHGCIQVACTTRAASPEMAPVLLSRGWGLKDILACPFLHSQSDSGLP